MSAFHGIECDACGTMTTWYNGLSRVSMGASRRILRDRGWHTKRVKGKPTRDICPACWAKGWR